MSDRIEKFVGEYAFLSNTHKSTFFYDGVKYTSVSQAYYVLRAMHDDDKKRIMSFSDASEMVRFGKTVDPREGWQIVNKDIMKLLLKEKFSSPFLADKLVKTGNAVLGNGRNFLGELLMEIRDQLKT